MDINYILENEELLKLLKSAMGKTYNHFKLKRIIEMEDFEQEVYLFIIPRIEKFDNKKSSLKTYIPLMVMSRAKQLIMLANGQCKDTRTNKLEFNEKLLSLDYEYTSEKTTTLSDVITDNEDLINNKLDNIEMEMLVDEILNNSNLTAKQKTILTLMSKGKTVSEIARMQNKSQTCIHITYIRAKEKIVKKYASMV